jgi:transposase-like protein
MRQAQRTFTPEFKQEAVHLLETSGKSGIVIAKDLGISDTILYRWRKELRATGNSAFPGKGHQTELEEEVHRLRREVETLRQERDILKKAAAIFLHSPQ